MSSALYIVIGCLAVLMLVPRLAPSDPARWHVDPRTGRPGEGRFVVALEGGDASGPVLDMTAGDLLARFDAIAMATPRTDRLAGSVPEGRITYITRSRGFGFPDYTTVEAVDDGQGARLIIFARLRYGRSDLGVNRQRVSEWLEALQAP